jgi:hypothetical protein
MSDAREGAPTASPVREEPPSETKLKSVPPPRPEATGYELEVLQLAAAIRAEPKLSQVDAMDLAKHAQAAGEKERPLAWFLAAVSDAARDTPQGELVHLTQKRVRVYLRNAKAPKRPAVEPKVPAQVESDDPAVVARIRKMPKRVTFDDPRAAAIVAKLGIGPPALQAPRQAMSEAELADKAREDRQRLAEDEKRRAGGT